MGAPAPRWGTGEPAAVRSPQPGDFRAARGLGANSFPVLVTAATNYVITPTRVTYPAGARFALRATIISPQGIPSTTFQAVLVQVTP